MTDQREAIQIKDFYDLRRKLWVEALCAALSVPYRPGEPIAAATAAHLADQAVEEFSKRFRGVM